MAKSVLGNDPFQTAAVVTEKPDTANKTKKSGKSRAKKTATKKSTAKKRVTKPKAAKSAAKKNTASTKAAKKTPKASARKKSVAKTQKAVKKTVAKDVVTPKEAANKKSQLPKTEENPAKMAEKLESKQEIKADIVKENNQNSDNAIIYDSRYTAQLRPEDFTIGQEYGFDPKFREKISPVLDLLYRIFWRVTVKGIENIPKEGKAVLVGNHAGILPFDGLMLNAALRKKAGREVWPLIEDFFYYAPILGSMLSKAGCVRACQENAQRLLGENELVAVFPEGIKGIVKPFRSRYRLQRFGRGGFVKLCLKTDSPVIPVAIVGAEESHPLLFNFNSLAKILKLPYFPVTPLFPLLGPLGLVPLPNKWTIVIGEPLYINQFGPETAGDRVAVNRLSAKIKSQIQKMIDMEIGQRNSRWK